MTFLTTILLTLLAITPVMAGQAADSLASKAGRLKQMADSLEMGISQVGWAWRLQEDQDTDSLRRELERNVVLPWKDWADNVGPRPGIQAEHFYRFAELYSMLDLFDVVGAYDQQLNCYKWAARFPGEEFRSTLLLHAQYRRVGFAPGMIQTGSYLMELDEEKALRSDVARSIAQAYFFVGDKKEARAWIKRHLKAKPRDEEARVLRQKIRKMPKKRD